MIVWLLVLAQAGAQVQSDSSISYIEIWAAILTLIVSGLFYVLWTHHNSIAGNKLQIAVNSANDKNNSEKFDEIKKEMMLLRAAIDEYFRGVRKG